MLRIGILEPVLQQSNTLFDIFLCHIKQITLLEAFYNQREIGCNSFRIVLKINEMFEQIDFH